MALVRVFVRTPCLSNTSVLRISSLQVFSSDSTSSSRESPQQSTRYSTSSKTSSFTVIYSGYSRSFSRAFSSGASAGGSGNNDSNVKAAWRFVVSVIKSFMSGSRRIWSDTKNSRSLAKKMGDLRIQSTAPSASSLPFAITPDELQLIYRTKNDVLKMFPTLLLFFIPVVGYVVPFIAYFVFPKYMLSQHFWNDSQRERYENAAMKERQMSLLQLENMIQDAARSNREVAEVLNRARQQMEQSSPSNGDWEWLKQHEKSASYWRLSSQQLTLLTKLWGVPTLLPFKWWKQRRLNNHLAYIYTNDWLLVSSKGQLDSKHVNEFALERCLLSTDKQDPVVFLRQWVKLSTTFNHCPTSLLAHLPLLWFQK